MHEAVWLDQLVDEMGLERETTTLYCDSSIARGLMKHAGKHRRIKQFNISDLKIREYVKKRGVKLEPVSSKANVVDMMTKPLTLEEFQGHRETIGVRTASVNTDASHASNALLASEEQSIRYENNPKSMSPWQRMPAKDR
ncbi:hypothetical protein JG687_00009033 [Phytophthora cactorum]|uniref:Uncharacterized protein n=1 Tax=Phytophthora cactorum TaxID=29920 RepID=A0A329SXP8_9STRA|nr:hypothetical protein JG687_00009033 [Phytophthora cactorum]RAW41231.1 hypothetical protein PC110_g2595 [Phytophthora cactorum]